MLSSCKLTLHFDQESSLGMQGHRLKKKKIKKSIWYEYIHMSILSPSALMLHNSNKAIDLGHLEVLHHKTADNG